MNRQSGVVETLRPYLERKQRIEAEQLPANVGALLDAAVVERPDHLAVAFFEDGVELTYRQLNDGVNRLANAMLSLGIRKGTHVGVMMPNIAAFPITWLALARLGAVMVPINVAYTARELEYVVSTADVSWLFVDGSVMHLVNEASSDLAPKVSGQIVVHDAGDLELSWEGIQAGKSSDRPEADEVGHDDLLNVQFTSGTTGFPKGVMLTHGYWLVSGKQNAFRDGKVYERILAATPFFYMDPQWLLLMAFYHRGTLFVARRQSGSRFMQWIRTHRINFCLLPEVVAKQPPHPLDGENDIIRANVYGLSKDLHHVIEARFNLVAREAYGMTEIGTGIFMPIECIDMIGSGSCGVATPFRQCRIMRSDGVLAQAGEVGELQVRGASILKGYYNNPQATEAAFQDGWFKTGDLFRRDETGFYFIVGRVKDMIRRAGENISAREVESVVMSFPQVRQTAAVAVKDEVRGEEVKAYVVLKDRLAPSQTLLTDIIEHCKANLAPFKVPRYFEFRSSLPMTASGKIAKARLTSETGDLLRGSFDRVDEIWR